MRIALRRSRGRADALRLGLSAVLIVKLVLIGLWCQSALAGPSATSHGPATTAANADREQRGARAATAEPDADPAIAKQQHDGGAASDTRLASTGPTTPAHGAVEKPDVRTLLDAVAKRNAELDARERELASREERLQVFEHDVTAKVASLEEIEKRLLVRSKEATAAVTAASESLAKIYGAMKPSDAAPILEQLDDATVLQIFGRMKEKQIGEILPLMARDKAIVLTRSLADRR